MTTTTFASSGAIDIGSIGSALLYPTGTAVSLNNTDVRLLAQKPGNVPISFDNFHGRSVFQSLGDSGNSGVFTGYSSALFCGTLNQTSFTSGGSSITLLEVGNNSNTNTCRLSISGHYSNFPFYAVAVSNGGFYSYALATNNTAIYQDSAAANSTTYYWNGSFTGMSIAVPFYVFVFM